MRFFSSFFSHVPTKFAATERKRFTRKRQFRSILVFSRAKTRCERRIFRESFSSEGRSHDFEKVRAVPISREASDPQRRSSASPAYDIAFLFFFLTRRASRTRRGYRWPTSEPISYSSKRPHSLSTIRTPSAATSVTTITLHHHRQQQQQLQLQLQPLQQHNIDTNNNRHSYTRSSTRSSARGRLRL